MRAAATPSVSSLFALVLTITIAFSAACSAQIGSPATSSTATPRISVALPAAGIRDHGDDPAVVAIEGGGHGLCGGVLVASDLVLTSRHCIDPRWSTAEGLSSPSGASCPMSAQEPRSAPSPPSSVRVLVGESLTVAEERARGSAIIVPAADPECRADVAILVLDTPIAGIQPMVVRPTGAARGDHLRTVAFAGPPSSEKIVGDHLRVTGTTSSELLVGEACRAVAGGPAIDEATAEIVGIASRPESPSCGGAGARDVYTRADVVLAFVAAAIGKSSFAATPARGQSKTKKGAVDMGASCARGSDCAAGICVTERDQQYCSRTCDAHDRCPPHFRCRRSADLDSVCVEG